MSTNIEVVNATTTDAASGVIVSTGVGTAEAQGIIVAAAILGGIYRTVWPYVEARRQLEKETGGKEQLKFDRDFAWTFIGALVTSAVFVLLSLKLIFTEVTTQGELLFAIGSAFAFTYLINDQLNKRVTSRDKVATAFDAKTKEPLTGSEAKPQ